MWLFVIRRKRQTECFRAAAGDDDPARRKDRKTTVNHRSIGRASAIRSHCSNSRASVQMTFRLCVCGCSKNSVKRRYTGRHRARHHRIYSIVPHVRAINGQQTWTQNAACGRLSTTSSAWTLLPSGKRMSNAVCVILSHCSLCSSNTPINQSVNPEFLKWPT